MTRVAALAAALLVGVLVAASPGYAVQGNSTSSSGFSVTVSRSVVHGGQRFTATATSSTPCHWVVVWNGIRRHRISTVFSTTFTAPEVEARTRIALHATCFAPPPQTAKVAVLAVRRPVGAAGASELIVVRVPVSRKATIVITVLPPGGSVSPPHGPGHHGHHGGHGGLPNTGGPELWLLLAGLGTALIGALLVGWASLRGRDHLTAA